MSKNSSQVMNPLKEEWNRRKQERASKRENSEPLLFRFINFIKLWAIRLFHTAFMMMLIYLVVAICTLIIPTVMGYVIGSMGYTLTNNAEMLLAFLCGLFFTGWVFVGSFVAVRAIWRKFIANIKATLPEKAAERLENLG